MRGAAFSEQQVRTALKISTHAPHARRGVISDCDDMGNKKFLLTRLMRGAAGDGRQNRAIR